MASRSGNCEAAKNKADKARLSRELTWLALKYEVIKTAERDVVCKLNEMFGCGKTQISVILRNMERIKDLYDANPSGQIR